MRRGVLSERSEPAAHGPERFAFVLVPNLSMIAFAAALEPLRIANRMADRELYGWQIVSRDGGPCARATAARWRSIRRSPTSPARARARRSSCAAGSAPSGSTTARCSPGCAAPIAPAPPSARCAPAPICGAGRPAQGPKCTIHWENLPGFMEDFPDIEVTADLFEVDRTRLTCSGGTAALDLMLHLIATRHGQELATKVSEQCLMDRIRQPHDQQRMPYRVRLGIHHPS